MTDGSTLTAHALLAADRYRSLPPVEVLDVLAARIDEVDAPLGASQTLCVDRARQEAHEAEASRRAERRAVPRAKRGQKKAAVFRVTAQPAGGDGGRDPAGDWNRQAAGLRHHATGVERGELERVALPGSHQGFQDGSRVAGERARHVTRSR